MIDAELKTTFNAILDGAAEVEETELDLAKREARIRIGVYPTERGIERDSEWRRLILQNLQAVLCWTGEEELPQELRFEKAASPVFMHFVASLFRNLWIYDWDLFTDPQNFLQHPPVWSWSHAEDWQQAECLFLHLERPGGAVWTLGLWFGQIEIETQMETIQSLKDFVTGWRFMSEDLES